MMKQTLNKHTALIKKINDLYVTYRRNFLEQYEKGNYITHKYPLTDATLEKHLNGEKTVGIKLGSQGLTKFMTWDVDFPNDDAKAKSVTIKLIQALHEYAGIELEEIHTDFSGSKGYHVTLFFDKVIQADELYPFYKEIVDYIGEAERNVEFRCSPQYGMKLPLGINQKSKKFMCFMQYEHDAYNPQLKKMSRKKSYNYFLNIQAMDYELFKEVALSDVVTILESEQAESFEHVMAEINSDGKAIEDLEAELIAVIQQNRLTYQSSRNRVTFLLSIFFKEQGYGLDETIGLIKGIILNTFDNYRELISLDTTKDYAFSEIERISKNTYEKGYSFSTRRKDVFVYADEIEVILDVKDLHLKKLLFSMLIHSKRYSKPNGIFYMAYSTMSRMGNTGNRGRLLKYLVQSEEMKLIKIVSQNQIDLVQSKIQGQAINKPNEYKCLFVSDKEQENGIMIKHNEELSLQHVTSLLIEEKKAKKKLPKSQWELHFKGAYKAI